VYGRAEEGKDNVRKSSRVVRKGTLRYQTWRERKEGKRKQMVEGKQKYKT
jgi:single-stranded DNA-binding protein